jgi:site-specific DNA recombinase
MAFAAELEREKIRERTSRGRRMRARSGKLLGSRGPLYGYMWADETRSTYIEHPEAAAIVRRVYADLCRGFGR